MWQDVESRPQGWEMEFDRMCLVLSLDREFVTVPFLLQNFSKALAYTYSSFKTHVPYTATPYDLCDSALQHLGRNVEMN